MESLSNQTNQTDPDGLSIRRVPIDALYLDPANARAHGEENLEAIVASLQRFGQAEPLVVHASTGRVIGGNGRLMAMKRLGWTEGCRSCWPSSGTTVNHLASTQK